MGPDANVADRGCFCFTEAWCIGRVERTCESTWDFAKPVPAPNRRQRCLMRFFEFLGRPVDIDRLCESSSEAEPSRNSGDGNYEREGGKAERELKVISLRELIRSMSADD